MKSNRVLRVCVVSPAYHTALGGVGRQALALTEKLGSLGLNIFVITRTMKGLPQGPFSAQIPVYKAWSLCPSVHNLGEKVTVLDILISLSFCFSTTWMLFRKQKEYDIVHFHGASLPLITNVLFLKLYRKKILAKVAAANLGTEAGSLKGKYGFLGQIMTQVLKKVDCFVAISEEIREGLLREGYERSKIAKIPNFIDQHVFYPSDEKLGEQVKKDLRFTRKKIITFTGRLVKRKGIDGLLNAWKNIVKHCRDILLVILGGGPLEETLKEQTRQLGIEETVIFCGFVDNVREYLIATDIFVFPSFKEGFPNSVLEAMACGLPVIASRIGGVVDMICDGENGLLFEPGDINQLTDALKRLILDTEYASYLGKNALETALAKYDLNVIARKYIRIYEGLVRS